MSTHNLCFEQKYEQILEFLSENFQFLVVKVSVYLNRRVFVMIVYCYLQYDATVIYNIVHCYLRKKDLLLC